MQNKHKLTAAQIFQKFGQFIFLSFKTSSENILWESASSCSYSFIFSFIPVVLIIFTILVSLLNIYPGMLSYVLAFCDQVKDIYDLRPLLESVMKMKSISLVNIFLAIWVIWMARKLFMSIVQAMNRIFLSVSQRKTMANQLITFISEFILVLLFISVIIVSFTFDKFLQLPIFEVIKTSAPRLFRTSSNILVSSVLYLMFFLFTLYSYKFLSGTKPSWKISAFYAFLSTAITFVISWFINKFMNFSNYNVIYGTISTMLVLLFKVYMFFAIFLFCAQMLYVSQLFEELIIANMYSSQNLPANLFNDYIWQKLFGNPSIYKMETKTIQVPAGETIFTSGDEADFVYLILKGSVLEERDDISITYKKGNFFGEVSGFINENHKSTTVTVSDCELMLIKTDKFREIIHKNHFASAKALERMNQYTKKQTF